jgi:hypothetical protein
MAVSPATVIIVLQLGNMNPVDFLSGVQSRLKNLDYYEGDVSGQLDDATRQAILEFQEDHGITPTGEADPDATKKPLVGPAPKGSGG